MQEIFNFNEIMNVCNKQREQNGQNLLFPSNYCVVDIETSGPNPENDSIIEITCVKYSNHCEVGTFHTLIQPSAEDDGNYIKRGIEILTGITNEMLVEAPRIEEVMEEFSVFLGKSLIVVYNADIDVEFIRSIFIKYKKNPISNKYIDVSRMARKIYPGLFRYRLRDMLHFLNFKGNYPHNAISDCRAIAFCFEEFMRNCKGEQVQ